MSLGEPHDDYKPEEVQPGLPEPLPDGEQILWQGSPSWRALARRALHVRQVAAYWLVLMGWVLAAGLYDGWTLATLTFPLSMLALLAALTLGTLAAIAWGSARSAIFTITPKRLVVRFGMAMRMTLNVPLTEIDSAGLRRFHDGTGDIPLALRQGQSFSWLVLWPFVRPWRLASPEIMLRGLSDVETVAAILAAQLAEAGHEQRLDAPEAASGTKAADVAGVPVPA